MAEGHLLGLAVKDADLLHPLRRAVLQADLVEVHASALVHLQQVVGEVELALVQAVQHQLQLVLPRLT